MVLHPNQNKAVEVGAQYRLPTTSSIVSRSTVKVLPSNGTSFTQNQQITIEIPSVGFLDNQASYLSFKLSTDADQTLVEDNSQSYIERVRVSTGSRNEVLCDIQNYNLLNGVLETLMTHKTYKEGAGDILEGTNTTVVTTATAPSQRRCIQLLGGILDNATYLPLKYMQGVTVDIFLSSDATCGATGLTISDISYVCEFLQMDAQYTGAFEQQFLTSGIKLAFDTYTTSQTTVNSTNVNKQITENVRSLKTVYTVQQQSTDPINVFRQARTKSIQYKFAGSYIPAQAINAENGGAECFKETMKAVNLSGDQSYDIDITKDEWSDDKNLVDQTGFGKKFIVAINLEKSPSQSMSGSDVSKNPLSVALTYQADIFGAKNPATTAVTMTNFVHYDAIAVFQANGTTIIY